MADRGSSCRREYQGLRVCLAGQHDQIKSWLDKGLKLTKVGDLLARRGVEVPYRTLHRYAVEQLGWQNTPPDGPFTVANDSLPQSEWLHCVRAEGLACERRCLMSGVRMSGACSEQDQPAASGK